MYIQVDEDFPQHPKAIRICAALGSPVAWAYMIRLWAWASKYQHDGELGGYEPAEIEAAAGWAAVDGRFYAAAARVGFIDEDEPGRPGRLHNWMRRTGGDIRRMEAEAERSRERKRTWRERRGNGDGTRDNDGTAGVLTAGQDAEERGGNAADKTRQVQARQDKQDPDLSLSPSPRRSDPDPEGACSNSGAGLVAFSPPRPARQAIPVGVKTEAFKSVFDRYPRKDGELKAAVLFADLAASTPGGESALAGEILAAFDRGMLSRHPYAGPNATRPVLETVLAERRWLEPPSLPDDEPSSRGHPRHESFAERDARLAREKAEREKDARNRAIAERERLNKVLAAAEGGRG